MSIKPQQQPQAGNWQCQSEVKLCGKLLNLEKRRERRTEWREWESCNSTSNETTKLVATTIPTTCSRLKKESRGMRWKTGRTRRTTTKEQKHHKTVWGLWNQFRWRQTTQSTTYYNLWWDKCNIFYSSSVWVETWTSAQRLSQYFQCVVTWFYLDSLKVVANITWQCDMTFSRTDHKLIQNSYYTSTYQQHMLC